MKNVLKMELVAGSLRLKSALLEGRGPKWPNCGKEKEIFSDEFDKAHICSGCGKEIDFTQCTLDAGN